MNTTTVNRLKKTGKIVAIASAIFFVLVAIIVNVIITPSKLTPLALKYADEYLDADVDIRSVEVTFFSSFPSFGVKVSDGLVVSHAFHKLPTDTVIARRDTLAQFAELRAELNLFSTLFSGDVIIGSATLTDATVRLYTDSLGRSNYDIVKADTTAVEEIGDDSESMKLAVKHIEIYNTKVRYVNKPSLINAGVRGLNLIVDGDINLDNMDIDVKLEDKSTSFRYDEKRYLRRMPLAINGHIAYDDASNQYRFQETCIELDGHDLDLDGYLAFDSLGTDFNLSYSLHDPSIEKLFALIPKDIVGEDIIVENGSVEATGYVRGRLDDTQAPVVGCNAIIENGKGHYEGMKRGVDDLSTRFDAIINPQKPDSSYVNMELFHFEGGNSEVEAVVKITELLANANVYTKFKAHVDLLSLHDVFPMPDTHLYGLVNADMTARFSLDDIKRRNYGRVKITGSLDVDSMSVVNDSLGFSLNNDAHLLFSGRDSLKMNAKVSYLELHHPNLLIRVRDLVADGRTILHKGKIIDTTAIVPMAGSFRVQHAGLKVDTLMFYGKRMTSSALFEPMPGNKRYPHVEAKLKADTLFSNIYGIRGVTRSLNTSVFYEQTGDSLWNTDMMAEMDMVYVTMPRYKMPIVATNTRITQKEMTINVERSHVRAGQTSMDVKAKVHNLYRSLMMHQPLEATLTVDADTVNCNELLAAYIVDEPVAPAVSDVALNDSVIASVADVDSMVVNTDSIPQRVIDIPKRIHFNFNSTIKTFKYDQLQVDDIKGVMEIVNGCLHVKNISFKQGKSKGISLFAYKADSRRQRADFNCFVRWERADIAELVSDLHLDTIMPMLGSFKGKIDCYMSIKAELDSTMTPDINTARASIHMGGKSLTLLDGETFSKLSKMLMFKNKKENLIDTLSFNVLVDSGKITVLPFVTNIDRYSAVVGGSQDFDMNLNYQVSVIKSPLPFKAGVSVKGTPDNLDFGITKAKLKKMARASEQLKNDSISLMRRLDVIRDMYYMSGLPMPQQLLTERERQQAELRAKMEAAESNDEDEYLDEEDDNTDEDALSRDSLYYTIAVKDSIGE